MVLQTQEMTLASQEAYSLASKAELELSKALFVNKDNRYRKEDGLLLTTVGSREICLEDSAL